MVSKNQFISLWIISIILVIADYLLLCTDLLRAIQINVPESLPNTIGYAFRGFFIFISFVFSNEIRNIRLSKNKRRVGGKRAAIIFLAIASTVFIFIPLIPSFRIYIYPMVFFTVAILFTVLSYTYPKNVHEARREISKKVFRKNMDGQDTFCFKTITGSLNIPEIFRGMIVIGSTGSGKSESVTKPSIHQAVRKGFSGIFYDIKFPEVTDTLYSACLKYRPKAKFYAINPIEPTKSHRLNILRPNYLKSLQHLEQYTLTFFHNLIPNLDKVTGASRFFNDSAMVLFKAVTWFLRNQYYEDLRKNGGKVKCYCTFPHVVELCCHNNIRRTITMLDSDPETSGLIASIKTALPQKGNINEQLMGVLSTLQVNLSRFISKEMYFILSGDDLDLNLNDPSEPKLLSVASSQSLSEAYSPVISLIFTIALNLMNEKDKHPSICQIDEFQTLKLPKIEVTASTCRSNRIALMLLCQDIPQLIDNYGPTKADTLLGLLNHQIYMKANHPKTAEHVVRVFGKDDRIYYNESRSASISERNDSTSKSVSEHTMERSILRNQDIIGLRKGEFYGVVAETDNPYIKSRFLLEKGKSDYSIPEFSGMATEQNMKDVFIGIKNDVEEIFEIYGVDLKRDYKKINI